MEYQGNAERRYICMGELLTTWDKVGNDRSLKSDTDIASFLLRYYQDTSSGNQSAACCINCLQPLSLSCSNCGTVQRPDLAKSQLNFGKKILPTHNNATTVQLNSISKHIENDQDDDVDLLADDPASPTAEQVARTMVQLAFTTEESPTPVLSAGTTTVTSTSNVDENGMHCCPHCGVKFSHANGLSRHLSLEICYTKPILPIIKDVKPRPRNVQIKQFKCAECTLEFDDEEKLTQHIKVHTHAMPYVCCHCGVGFLEKTVLNYHLKTHEGLHVCHRCGSEFVNKHGLTAHLKTNVCLNMTESSGGILEAASSQAGIFPKLFQRNRRKKFINLDKNACTYCGKKLASPSHLKRHILTHTGERPYVCQECGASFTQKARLIDHHNRNHASEKPIKCGSCSMTFFTTLELSKHPCSAFAGAQDGNTDGQSGDTRPYKCQYCNAEFANPNHLTAHIQTHTGQKEFKCQHCDRAFGAYLYLKQHLKKHTRPKVVQSSDARPFKCHMCTAAFKTRKMLTIHIRTHTGEKPFKCTDCGKGFAQRCNYRRHIRIHTGERPYQCKECGATFAHNTTYIGHMRTHTGDKPYKCKVCEKAFRQSYGLTIHMRTHSNDKPYKCTHCDSAFSHPSSLTIHVRKHTGEKPFKCQYCDHAFSSASNRRAHVKKQHKEYVLESCSQSSGNRKPRGRKPKNSTEKSTLMENNSCAQVQNLQNPPTMVEQQPPPPPQPQNTYRPEAIPMYGLWDGVRPPLQFPQHPDPHRPTAVHMQAVWDGQPPHDLSLPRPHPHWN